MSKKWLVKTLVYLFSGIVFAGGALFCARTDYFVGGLLAIVAVVLCFCGGRALQILMEEMEREIYGDSEDEQ